MSEHRALFIKIRAFPNISTPLCPADCFPAQPESRCSCANATSVWLTAHAQPPTSHSDFVPFPGPLPQSVRKRAHVTLVFGRFTPEQQQGLTES